MANEEFVEVVLNIAKGDIFKCFEDAEQKITESAREKFVQFYKRESRTISGGAKKTKRYLNPELKFYQVEWACVHGGRNFKCRGNGIRNSRTLKYEVPCPAQIRMKVSPKGDDFVIASVNNKHNHIVSESLFNQLPHRRKLPPELKKQTKKLLDLHVNRRMLRDEIARKYNKQITMKDLANIHNEDKVRKKMLSQQTKYKLLSTKLQKAASLGVEAYGENFDNVCSLFDDIIEMLQNKIYKFEFTYEKTADNNNWNVEDERCYIVNNANNNIDISIEDEDNNIEHCIANDDTSDNIHVYSNINVASIETVETFNQDDNDAIMVNNSMKNATKCSDTVFNDHVKTETFNHDHNNVIPIDGSTENRAFNATDEIECPDTVFKSDIIISENYHVKTETCKHNNNDVIIIGDSTNLDKKPAAINAKVNINIDCHKKGNKQIEDIPGGSDKNYSVVSIQNMDPILKDQDENNGNMESVFKPRKLVSRTPPIENQQNTAEINTEKIKNDAATKRPRSENTPEQENKRQCHQMQVETEESENESSDNFENTKPKCGNLDNVISQVFSSLDDIQEIENKVGQLLVKEDCDSLRGATSKIYKCLTLLIHKIWYIEKENVYLTHKFKKKNSK